MKGNGWSGRAMPLFAFVAGGGEVAPPTPEEAAAFIRSEVAKWARILKDANIPLEQNLQ